MTPIHCHSVQKQLPNTTDAFQPHKRNLRIRLLCTWKFWYQNWRSRRELGQLSDDMLKDIGISRAEAEQEYSKPFWKE